MYTNNQEFESIFYFPENVYLNCRCSGCTPITRSLSVFSIFLKMFILIAGVPGVHQ